MAGFKTVSIESTTGKGVKQPFPFEVCNPMRKGYCTRRVAEAYRKSHGKKPIISLHFAFPLISNPYRESSV